MSKGRELSGLNAFEILCQSEMPILVSGCADGQTAAINGIGSIPKPLWHLGIDSVCAERMTFSSAPGFLATKR